MTVAYFLADERSCPEVASPHGPCASEAPLRVSGYDLSSSVAFGLTSVVPKLCSFLPNNGTVTLARARGARVPADHIDNDSAGYRIYYTKNIYCQYQMVLS